MRQPEAAPGERPSDPGGSRRAQPSGPQAASPAQGLAALSSLCAIARLHQVAAEPEALRHQLGLGASASAGVDELLIAAKQLGLKAKLSRTGADRLKLTPLPALALMSDGRVVVLAQCDGQRVLFLDPAASAAGRPRARRSNRCRLRGAVERRADPITSRGAWSATSRSSISVVHPEPCQVPQAAQRSFGRVDVPAALPVVSPLSFRS